MATTEDYLAYLNEEIGIAPANSQEELQASQVIADVYRSHGLEPTIQEFDAPANTNLTAGILFVIVFAGAFLSGLPAGALSVIGALLAIAAVVLLVMRYFGNDVLGSYGPTIRSQNIIGYHQATGDLVAKGNRPIVIVAHYDTPREDFYYKEPFAQYQAKLKQGTVIFVPVVGVLALFQLFGFLPGAFRGFLWVVEIICALPLLLWGVSIISRNFSSCTLGSNDNKAAVAAMMGIMANVRPTSADEADRLRAERAKRVAANKESAGEPEPSGLRHGEQVVRELGILPETCEIVYDTTPSEETEDEAEYVSAPFADPAEGMAATAAARRAEERAAAVAEAKRAADEAAAEKAQQAEEEAEETSNLGETSSFSEPKEDESDSTAKISEPAPAPESEAEPEPEQAPAAPRLHKKVVVPKISSEPSETSEPVDADKTVLVSPTPAATEAPSTRQSAGRRAALFDLPDPSTATVDPLASDNHDDAEATVVVSSDDIPASSQQDEIGVITPEDLEAKQSRKRRHLFGRRKKNAEEESMSDWLGVDSDYDAKKNGRKIGSWDNLDKDDDSSDHDWKGGATQNGRFRVIEGSAPEHDSDEDPADAAFSAAPVEGDEASAQDVPNDAPDAEDLREAVLSMGDDELICHDIWFVALGASEVNHAGIRAFLNDYRKMCRGAFLINLDCIGAGDLTVLTQEGLDNRRKADRRLIRLLDSTAKDIHVDLGTATMTWSDTDATPAMRTSMRSATIVGMDENGLPAYERSMGDTEDVVDPKQVEDVCALVTEAIRRS